MVSACIRKWYATTTMPAPRIHVTRHLVVSMLRFLTGPPALTVMSVTARRPVGPASVHWEHHSIVTMAIHAPTIAVTRKQGASISTTRRYVRMEMHAPPATSAITELAKADLD